MKALVIYDLVFGNTEKVAKAIAEGLEAQAGVEFLRPEQVDLQGLASWDLLVVGSPTLRLSPDRGDDRSVEPDPAEIPQECKSGSL